MRKSLFICCFLFMCAGTLAAQVKVGILLPLNKNNAEGMQMLEYCRGLLLSVDSLKREGQNVDIVTVNTPADADMTNILEANPALNDRDVIFGPFYPKHVPAVSEISLKNGNKVVLPYLTNTKELNTNPNFFQIPHNTNMLEQKIVERIIKMQSERGKFQVVIIDCNDSTDARRPSLTAYMKIYCDEKGINYRITSLTQTDEKFIKAFSKKKNNLIVPNSASQQKMLELFAKLEKVREEVPAALNSVLGHTEWQAYIPQFHTDFYKNDVYIPSTFFSSPADTHIKKINDDYRFWFKTEPLKAEPSFVVSGFEQGYYFIKGVAKYGKEFVGSKAQSVSKQIQTPLWFEKITQNGGYMNNAFMFIHFRNDGNTEIISY